MTNPYQHIIDWLHTYEGEAWSEQRITNAAHRCNGGYIRARRGTCVNYGPSHGPIYLGGVFSIKDG